MTEQQLKEFKAGVKYGRMAAFYEYHEYIMEKLDEYVTMKGEEIQAQIREIIQRRLDGLVAAANERLFEIEEKWQRENEHE